MMTSNSKPDIFIGVDPGGTVKGNGVAVWLHHFIEGNRMNPFDLMDLIIKYQQKYTVIVALEDISSKGTWSATKATNDKTRRAAASRIGQPKYAQIVVEQLCERLGVRVVKYKPSSKWKGKTNKPNLRGQERIKEKLRCKLEVAEFVTKSKFTGRTNDDVRSAAYFAFKCENETKYIKGKNKNAK